MPCSAMQCLAFPARYGRRKETKETRESSDTKETRPSTVTAQPKAALQKAQHKRFKTGVPMRRLGWICNDLHFALSEFECPISDCISMASIATQWLHVSSGTLSKDYIGGFELFCHFRQIKTTCLPMNARDFYTGNIYRLFIEHGYDRTFVPLY